MMMSVNERVQEIGILLSIGTEKGEVRRMFLYEAFILGIIGAVVGGLMSLDHRVLGRECDDREHRLFLPAGEYHLCPVRDDHRDRRLHRVRALPGMEGIEHGPDRCPEERVNAIAA